MSGQVAKVLGGEPASRYSGDEDNEDLMRRRAFLLNAAILAGISKTDPVAALEAARRGLDDAFLSRHDADLDEWEEVARDYGETYPVTPPADLVSTLLVDFVGLQEAFRTYPRDKEQRDLFRVSALFAGFLAQTLNNLGHPSEARRWWRSARYAAEKAGDSYSPLWVRGREIIHSMGQRPAGAILRLIDEGCGSSGVTLCGEFRVVRDLVSGSPVSVRV
jgi:hypothetical protein